MSKLAIHGSISSITSSGSSVAASDDTWRTDMKCAFPGPAAIHVAVIFR